MFPPHYLTSRAGGAARRESVDRALIEYETSPSSRRVLLLIPGGERRLKEGGRISCLFESRQVETKRHRQVLASGDGRGGNGWDGKIVEVWGE